MIIELIKLLISIISLVAVGFLANKSLDTSNDVNVVVYIILWIVVVSGLKISKDSIITLMDVYKIFKK